MIFSGTDYRKIQEKDDYNFFINGSFDNTTGKAAIGFSGEGEKFNFNFLEGRIIDPNDNYVFSYDTGNFEISGIVNDGNYSYHINDRQINLSGTKNSFKADRFFVDCSGCSVNIENFIVKGSGATTFEIQSLPGLVGDSGVITGAVVPNDATFGKFDIFSGEVLTNSVTGLFAIETSLSTGISDVGVIGISGIQGIENQSPYIFEANLYTSFGEVNKTFRVTGSTPFYQPELRITDGSDLTSGGLPNIIKTGNYTANYDLFTGAPTYATGLPINISLSYFSGYTGQITGALTGVSMIETGQNYSLAFPPKIIVTGDGQNAEVSGLISPQGTITGMNIANGGSGYSTPPTILIYSGVSSVAVTSGGTGYFSQPVIQFSGGLDTARGGTHAVASANLNNGTIQSFSISSGGTFYSGIPTLSVIPGLSGVGLTSSGSGYTGVPSVFVLGGGGSGASVTALTGNPNTALSGFITGFNLVGGGSGYTGIPSILLSGGNPQITGSGQAILASGFVGVVNMCSGAEASGLLGDYTKSFSGQFNLLTGSGGSFAAYEGGAQLYDPATVASGGRQISGDNLSYTGQTIHFRENSTLAIGVESEVDIQVLNQNYYDSLPLIAKLSVSGSGAFPPFVPADVLTVEVTGIK